MHIRHLYKTYSEIIPNEVVMYVKNIPSHPYTSTLQM